METLLALLSNLRAIDDILPALQAVDPDDPSWLSMFDTCLAPPGLHAEDGEEDADEIVPPRIHTRGAQRLLLAEAEVSCVAVRWGPNQGTAPHHHHNPPGSRHWMMVLQGAIECISSSGQKVLHSKGEGPVEVTLEEWEADTHHQVRNYLPHSDAVVLHVRTPMVCETCFSCDKVLAMPLVPDLTTLAELLSKVIPATTPGCFHSEATIGTVKALLESVTFSPEAYSRLCEFAPDRYTRNLVGTNGLFTMLVLCWDKKQASPIHDHTGSSCWVRLLEGELCETRYKVPPPEWSSGLVVAGEQSLTQHSPVAYINDSQGLHRMGNPSDAQGCVTLHIYSPPFSTTKIYDLETARQTQVNIAAPSARAKLF